MRYNEDRLESAAACFDRVDEHPRRSKVSGLVPVIEQHIPDRRRRGPGQERRGPPGIVDWQLVPVGPSPVAAVTPSYECSGRGWGRTASRGSLGAILTLIALTLGVGPGPVQGQTMSFFRQFETPGTDQASAVAADSSGIYVFVGNRGFSQGGGVRKYDARGDELWTREFNIPEGNVIFVGAAADATGVYVVGYIHPVPFSGAGSGIFRKYSADGGELWTRELEFYPAGGVGVDDTGVYVAGELFDSNPSGFLRKYNAEGAELWTSQFQDSFPVAHYGDEKVFVDSTGAYVLGPSSGNFFNVVKWDTRGNELWNRQLDVPDAVLLGAAADPAGFFVVGNNGRSQFLRKYDADGNQLWTRPIATSNAPYPHSVVADATGVYIAGTTSLAAPAFSGQCKSGSGSDSFVRKYDADGAELWTREFGTSDDAWASEVAVDAGGVYIVGRYGRFQLNEWFPFGPLTSGTFLAKFEKTAAMDTGSAPRIFPDCVVNAASYVGGGVAPGEIVTLFGSAMGPAELSSLRLGDDGRLATTLGDARILFDGVPAPLVYVSDKQSSAIVPYSVAGRSSVDVQVEYLGVRSEAVPVAVLASRPGIFSLDGSGQGQGAVLNEDGSLNSPSNPAQRGSIISIYGTGGGEASPGVIDGEILSDALLGTSLPVLVAFNLFTEWFDANNNTSTWSEALYAGGSPGSVAGLLQVNVRVPLDTTPTGDAVPITLIIGSHWTLFQVTIALR